MKENNFKKFIIILIISLFTFLLFSEELSDWSFNKIIKVSGNNKYKFFFLDKEVYQYANQDLSDLRIVDENKKFIPYYINEEFQEETEESKIYNSKQIYKQKDDKKNFSVYDFQGLSKKTDLEINRLVIETNMDNYSKQVEIYGRNDNSNWALLARDTIYRIEDFVKEEINLGKNSKNNFYRIKVLDNTENLVITKCTLFYSKYIKESQQYIKEIELKFEVENKDKYSIVNIKNIYNLKLIKLYFEIGGNFKRSYDLYDGTTDYIFKRGNIYNFKSDKINITNTEVDLDYNYLSKNENKLIILNNDNQPLKINNIIGSYLIDKIIFEETGSKSFFLYFGNTKAFEPDYDIVSYKNYIDKEEQNLCSLDKINNLKPLVAEKRRFNYKLLFNLIIVFASILLIVILVIKLTNK